MKTKKLPAAVQAASETIGGYFGMNHAYFSYDGKPVEEGDHQVYYIVVGNYYGAAVFSVNDGAGVVREDDEWGLG